MLNSTRDTHSFFDYLTEQLHIPQCTYWVFDG
jgi:hypothetical protein